MRKYLVNVNGTSYEIEVEEISGASGVSKSVPQVQAPEQEKIVKAEPKEQAAVSSSRIPVAKAGQETIYCPMPGTILNVQCDVGDTVKDRQLLFILEAMKMENEILSTRDGKIVAVAVKPGATVNAGDVLCIIE